MNAVVDVANELSIGRPDACRSSVETDHRFYSGCRANSTANR